MAAFCPWSISGYNTRKIMGLSESGIRYGNPVRNQPGTTPGFEHVSHDFTIKYGDFCVKERAFHGPLGICHGCISRGHRQHWTGSMMRYNYWGKGKTDSTMITGDPKIWRSWSPSKTSPAFAAFDRANSRLHRSWTMVRSSIFGENTWVNLPWCWLFMPSVSILWGYELQE